MINKKQLSMIIPTIALSGCTSYNIKEDKMNRYNPKTISRNHVPELKVLDFKFQETNSRFPASAPIVINEVENQKDNTSNKKLYFLTLLDQYENLKTYSQEFNAPKLNICPHFHTTIVDRNLLMKKSTHKEIKTPVNFVYDFSQIHSDEYLSKKPELSLPIVKDSLYPRVIDIIRKEKDNSYKVTETVEKALNIHLAKTYTEIQQLCEFGASDNYYIYENLISHVKSKNFKAEVNNLNTLLKTTLFSNMALSASLERNYKKNKMILKNGPTYDSEVLSRMNVNWAKEYFDYIKN